MQKFLDWLKAQWKALVVAVAFAAAFLVPVIFHVAIPDWVFTVLGAVGFASVRLAVGAISGNNGWKSFVAAGIVFVVGILHAFGVVISPDIMGVIYTIASVFGIVGIHEAVTDIES